MEKIISQLDQFGYFVGPAIADPSPLEPGVFLLPMGAIDMKPPANPAPGKRYRPEGGAWVEEDALQPAKPSALEIWGRIKNERDRRKAGGVKVGAKWLHSDDGSRIQQMGLAMMGANLPAGLQWKTMDGSFITMTPAFAQQVFTTQAASDQTIFAAAETHRVAMEASADPATYDYSTGWPKIFGE